MELKLYTRDLTQIPCTTDLYVKLKTLTTFRWFEAEDSVLALPVFAEFTNEEFNLASFIGKATHLSFHFNKILLRHSFHPTIVTNTLFKDCNCVAMKNIIYLVSGHNFFTVFFIFWLLHSSDRKSGKAHVL